MAKAKRAKKTMIGLTIVSAAFFVVASQQLIGESQGVAGLVAAMMIFHGGVLQTGLGAIKELTRENELLKTSGQDD